MILFFVCSCKVVRERKNCVESTKDKISPGIENFQELKSYVKIKSEDIEEAVWIIDGIVIVDSIEDFINNKKFDLLNVEVIPEEDLTWGCKRVSAYVLIASNNCLNKYL
ncbi:hypothetical protein [Seonamhaeicola maritimus]|uniref:hypothetical protein n=1 Tax=Seonamhaeicola maritimus TaxID=2591822 RepID=UPI0024956BCE|nr:hypothetical protein [Seonamhaeicola maritimus]